MVAVVAQLSSGRVAVLYGNEGGSEPADSREGISLGESVDLHALDRYSDNRPVHEVEGGNGGSAFSRVRRISVAERGGEIIACLQEQRRIAARGAAVVGLDRDADRHRTLGVVMAATGGHDNIAPNRSR